MQWNINFGPGFISPEQMEAQRQQQEALEKQMIDEKRCVVCKNTYLINDQITMCTYSNKCVDQENGQQCEHWESLI